MQLHKAEELCNLVKHLKRVKDLREDLDRLQKDNEMFAVDIRVIPELRKTFIDMLKEIERKTEMEIIAFKS